MKNKSKIGYTVYTLTIIILIVAFIVFVLEKQQVIKICIKNPYQSKPSLGL